jgi:hypothetical protein
MAVQTLLLYAACHHHDLSVIVSVPVMICEAVAARLALVGKGEEGGGVRSGPGDARTILLLHTISARPCKTASYGTYSRGSARLRTDWFRCDDIPAAGKCASVSRWACRKRRRKNSSCMRVDVLERLAGWYH